jgi:putative hydrolase of HD superfamily
MDVEQLIDLFLETTILKRMPRTGWGMRGVFPVESVAEHSYGVAFVALALADCLQAGAPDQEVRGTRGSSDPTLDMEKVLIMALLHDLAEARLTDLPASAVRLIPRQVKSRAEAGVVVDMLRGLPTSNRFVALWQEFEDESSPEGRLVRDADKLEMMVQCLRYEMAGSRGLDEFWTAMDRRRWHYPLSAEVYRWLRGRRRP